MRPRDEDACMAAQSAQVDVLSVLVDTVDVHGQPELSAMGDSGRQQVPRMARDTEDSDTKQLAEGLTHLDEAIRALDAKCGERFPVPA
jgi:hypothetical protein